ncbi:MAG: glycosyltransferase [Gracilibacteraceae bacterium]|jgi:glycosyltransferase involved in cell wall biosynthesis|nr:glycosyltransferase [Gracilibacteraceae bacterium]
MPQVSVIMPVYNAETYLARAVDSVLAQTLRDLELILVDDGSTDTSSALCDDYAARDDRVRVIRQKNGGAPAARNAGIAAASSEYIGFMDSDDYILPAMYERLHLNAVPTGRDAVNCGSFVLNDKDFTPPYPRAEDETRRYPAAYLPLRRANDRRPGYTALFCL